MLPRRAIVGRVLVNKRCASHTIARTGQVVDGRWDLPLDAVVNELVSNTAAPAVLWPAPPKAADVKAIARTIRASIAANDFTALDVLRSLPRPHPRFVIHATVHALLRARQAPRASALLLAFANERASASKLPRISPITLAETIKALLELVPKIQGRQDRVRTTLSPKLLLLDAQLVSEPALRTALALYIKARQLYVHRTKDVTTRLWYALVSQREWIPAALFIELQVKDYQLRHTLRTVLRAENPAKPLNPHHRHHIRRRLDLLRREDIRPNRGLFTDLCFRIAGVISSITKSPESGLLSTQLPSIEAHGRPIPPVLTTPVTQLPKTPLTPQRAQHHARVALQALAILAPLIDARQVPFGDISAWVTTVGSLPSSLARVTVYTMVEGRPELVGARAYLRRVLERYATSLPRVPHIYSEFPFRTSGFERRGLKHTSPDLTANLVHPDSPYFPPEISDGTGPSPSTRHFPPKDPAEAADDSLMPPPLMPTYESLLNVFLNPGNKGRGPGALFEAAPKMDSQPARWNAGAELVEAKLEEKKDPRIPDRMALEAKTRQGERESVQGHYHAPRSPNNPDPLHLQYPAHPLDFDKYPDASRVPPGASGAHADAARVQAQLEKLGPVPVALHRVRVVAIVLRHMLYKRNPAMPPWESEGIMRLLERRADVLKPLIGRTEEGFNALVEWKDSIIETEKAGARGLWEAVWEGDARARRETEVNAAEARRIVAEAEYEAGATRGHIPWSTRMDAEEQEQLAWRVDRESGVLRPKGKEDDEDERPEQLEMLNRRLVAKTADKELEMYHNSAG
ncbi:hypothetical protein K438DRAFT_1925467 [Mycena galopus ATCC 62051]|nr:hypothetical protein K438DRAFT_1925467 [Mycena galopus ATCC 62051]